MQIALDVPEYSRDRGLQTTWEPDHRITVKTHDGDIVIRANTAGLVSLARVCLALAQEAVPVGHHVHLDEHNSLEEGSETVVFEKTESDNDG